MSDLQDFAAGWVEAFNAHDADRMGALWADNCVLEAPGDVRLEGRDAVVAYAMDWLDAFPDARMTVHQRIVGDPWVVDQFTFEGTHDATLHSPAGDIAATGRRLVGRGTEAFRVENGRAVECQLYFDQVQVLTQLGLMPEPSTA